MKKTTKKYYYAVIDSESEEINDCPIYETIEEAAKQSCLGDFIISLEVVDVYNVNKQISKSSVNSLEEMFETNKSLF